MWVVELCDAKFGDQQPDCIQISCCPNNAPPSRHYSSFLLTQGKSRLGRAHMMRRSDNTGHDGKNGEENGVEVDDKQVVGDTKEERATK